MNYFEICLGNYEWLIYNYYYIVEVGGCMEKINVLFDEETLNNRIKELGDKLYQEYKDEPVVFVCVLKGAVFFACDLAKSYKGDARIEFLRVKSYEGENTTGTITMKLPLNEESVKGKHVLIVEDIVDTGKTMKFLQEYVASMGAKSVKSCSLLDKLSRRVEDVKVDYIGFEIEDLFVIGYGLDYDEKYRNLPYIGVVVHE